MGIYYSNTYEKIQQKSDIVWKNQRYHLIFEYIDSPIIPPPLNLIHSIWFSIFKKPDCATTTKDKFMVYEENVTDTNFYSNFCFNLSVSLNKLNFHFNVDNNFLINYERKMAKEFLKTKKKFREENSKKCLCLKH